MKTMPQEVTKRILFILHRGLTEIRNLALGEGNRQIADLADALEILPQHALHCTEDEMELIRFVLKDYQTRYPQSSYGHGDYLDKKPTPEDF
jgi:hypothetical protein